MNTEITTQRKYNVISASNNSSARMINYLINDMWGLYISELKNYKFITKVKFFHQKFLNKFDFVKKKKKWVLKSRKLFL